MRISTLDLVKPGRFLLLAGEQGQAWLAAVDPLAAELDLPIDGVRIGPMDGDLLDSRRHWMQHREITAEGAILVRPDRFVAWRSAGGVTDRVEALRGAFGAIPHARSAMEAVR